MRVPRFLIQFKGEYPAFVRPRSWPRQQHIHDLGHRRDAQRAQEYGFNHFTATLLLAGELKVNRDDGSSFLPRPGKVLLADTSVPGTIRMRHAHIVTLSIARDRMSVLPVTSMACMG